MGAESSSLRAIDSLNDTLANIERKLGVIEDVHLHHERTICHDNVVLVSGKQIVSNPNVDLVVGPIVGLITQDSVRILVETNNSATLTVNFFLLDEIHTESRFVHEDTLVVREGIPIAKSFHGLLPGTNYAVYLGGCRGATTLLHYASFTTLPRSSSTISPRIIFTQGGRIDKAVPGEVNMWSHAGDIIGKGAKGRDAAKLSAKNEGDTMHNQTVHMCVHMGNFLQVDNTIRARAIELLDMVTRDDVNIEAWDEKMNEAEEAVRELYRKAFTNEDVRRILRRCGHLFLSGEGEAGSLTSSFLGMAPGPKYKSEEEREKEMKETGGTGESKNDKGKKGKGEANLSFRQQREAAAKEEAAKAKALAKLKRGPLKRGEIDEDLLPVDNDRDLLVPAIGGSIRRNKEELLKDLEDRTQLNEELRILLLGTILRMLRRVSWAYMRQLWDDEFDALLTEDMQIEENQRAVLKIRKYLQVRLMLLGHLEKTRKKLVLEFGEEYKASFDVAERCKIIAVDVESVENRLRALLSESALIIARCKEPPNGTAVDVGGVVLILLETCWGWLGRDGLAQTIYSRDIPISGKIVTELDRLLFEGRGTNTPSGDEVRTVICASAGPLIPYTTSTALITSNPYEPQPFTYSPIDVGKLLKTIALWQQRSPDRVTLMASVCPFFAAKGWIFPISSSNDDDDKPTKKKGGKKADEGEGWNGDRCKLRVILVGAMDRQTKAKGESRYAAGESTTPKVPLIDQFSGFQTTFDRGTTCSRRCFWNTLAVPSVKARKLDGKWITGVDSLFQLACISDQREAVNVTIGPIVGRVTSTSAIILLEAAEDCHVELLCVDQLTGILYTNSKLMKRNRPTIFTFNQLSPGRAYDVRLATHAGYTLPAKHDAPIPTQASLQIRGTFCTSVHGSWGVYDQEHSDLATTLRVEAHGLKEIEGIGAEKEKEVLDQAAGATDDLSLAASSVVGASSAGGAGGGTGSLKAKNEKDKEKELAATPVALRAFVVGANKPSWLRLLPHIDAVESDESALGLDRVHLANGLATMQAIADISARSWTPVPLTIHCGYSVDLSSVMHGALTLVYRAEEYYSKGDTSIASTLQEQALEILRNAYKLHWGGSSTRQLLAHGSHIIVSSPMLDLLHAFNSPTLRQLTRDHSQYSTQSLLSMITKLNSEYEGCLWDGGLSLPNSDGFTRASNRTHFLAGGSVALFPLQIRTITAQDNYGTSEDGLLSEYLFDSLNTLLGFGNIGSSINNQEQQVQTLVLISPLPLVHHDPQFLEGTFLNTEARGMAYSPSEVLRLLDMLCLWVESEPGRQVIVLAGGVDVGHGTTIVCRQINPRQAWVNDDDDEEDEEEDEISIEKTSKALKLLGVSSENKEKEPEIVAPVAAAASPKKGGWGLGGLIAAKSDVKLVIEEKITGPTPEQIAAERRVKAKAERIKARKQRRLQKQRHINALAALEADRKSQPILIKQLCVAPLVGVPGDDIPVESGVLISKERIYTYKHDSLDSGSTPHCGYIEIFDNRINVNRSRAACKAAADAQVPSPPYSLRGVNLDIIDHLSIRSYVTEDDIIGTNQLDHIEKHVVRALDLSVLKDTSVQHIWKHASAHLSGNRKRKSNVPQNAGAIEISTAITDVMDDDGVIGLYPFVHKAVFMSGTLPLPFSGGASVEDTILAAARILLSNMPREYHDLCPLPSSLALRLVWSKLVLAETKLHKKALEKSAGNTLSDDTLPGPVSMVVASITADAGYLAYYLRQAIEAQALMEHFAVELGYNDLNM